MGDLTIWTYDWVPEAPRGHVRDLRLRWTAEEAGRPYVVRTVPIMDRGAAHLARQPFHQVPFLDDGDLRLFESGACVMQIAEGSALLPASGQARADVVEWVFAALNSVEVITLPWWFVGQAKGDATALAEWMDKRFDKLGAVLEGRDWIAGSEFSVADVLMADVLRIPRDLGALERHPGLAEYVARACARPAFKRAHRAQMDHFAVATPPG